MSDVRNQEILIIGTVTSQGKYADGKDICEIYIHKEYSDLLPHQFGQRSLISLSIKDIVYEAGARETGKKVVWVSSVLHKKGLRKEQVRLVDALAKNNSKKGNKIKIAKTGEIYFLS